MKFKIQKSPEGFKEIKQFPNYFVSECGEVFSGFSGKLKKQSTDPKGYKKVMIYLDGKQNFLLVHRLVAMAFLGEAPKGKPTVNHIDGNKANNNHSNLEWCSYKYNEQDKRVRLGLSGFGSTNYNCKFGFKQAEEIRSRLKGLPYSTKERTAEMKKIREEYNISQTSIRLIVIGERWTSEV